MKPGLILLLASIATALGGEPAVQRQTLEGVLREHPKYLYRYYIDGFGDGQKCALHGLERFPIGHVPGSRIKVAGKFQHPHVEPFHQSLLHGFLRGLAPG